MRTLLVVAMIVTALSAGLLGQISPPPLAPFDVLLIKRNDGTVDDGRLSPGGSAARSASDEGLV